MLAFSKTNLHCSGFPQRVAAADNSESRNHNLKVPTVKQFQAPNQKSNGKRKMPESKASLFLEKKSQRKKTKPKKANPKTRDREIPLLSFYETF